MSRKDAASIYPLNESFLLEQNVVHFNVIEDGKILSGHELRDKTISNNDISILSGKMKISETISENIRESCSLKPKKQVDEMSENEDDINIL